MESKTSHIKATDINYPVILSKVILIASREQRESVDINGNMLFQYCAQYDFDEFKNQLASPLVSLPLAIIVCYHPKFSKEIFAFGNYLAQRKRLKPVPILLASDPEDVNDIQSNRLSLTSFDDLITNDISFEQLIQKIRLLRKLKEVNFPSNPLHAAHLADSDTEKKSYLRKAGRILKRVIDIFASAFLLLLLSPVFIMIAILVKVDSKGPIFYAGKRTGTDYRVFKFLKFRTMVQGADKGIKSLENQYNPESGKGPVFYKFKNDPRVTKVGAFLRKTSLDEIPQLVNVLIGDMSLVGNRPLPLYEAQTLTVDEYVERFDAPAGITGLWQIRKRGKKDMSVKERISLDVFYARHQSLGFDMKILLETPKALMQEEDV